MTTKALAEEVNLKISETADAILLAAAHIRNVATGRDIDAEFTAQAEKVAADLTNVDA